MNKNRIILSFLGIIALVLIASAVLIFNSTPRTELVNAAQEMKNRLVIPPLLHVQKVEHIAFFDDLILQSGLSHFFEGKNTPTWGANGSYLGPTIRIHTGDILNLNIKNTLPEDTTIHWHGAEVPQNMDGGPYQQIKSGSIWHVRFPIVQQAATLWYHPHTMGKTAPQVYRGLAGFFIIDDAHSDSLPLPKTYGVDDIPLVIQDRKFDSSGAMIYSHVHNHETTAGMLGDTILVNGVVGPYANVPSGPVRLRILNGSNARRYNIGFSNNLPFDLIATDGGFINNPIRLTRLVLAPGERAEIVINTATQRDSLMLVSFPIKTITNLFQQLLYRLMTGPDDEYQQFNILELKPNSMTTTHTQIPHDLNTIVRYKRSEIKKTRVFRLNSAAINDLKMDQKRVDEVVKKGDLELWEIRNSSPIAHPFHLHGAQFQILERNTKSPPPWEMGWKDTVLVGRSEQVKLMVKFEFYSDPTLPYMYHCHNLEHEDMGMMGQFVVVDRIGDTLQLKELDQDDTMQMH